MRGVSDYGRTGTRGRAQRGDVRVAILILLADEPMHGYQLMQSMADRTQGAWRPSAGAIYPTLSTLKEAGLVSEASVSGRKLASLTEAGEAYVEENRDKFVDPFALLIAESGGQHDLRGPLDDLRAATRLLARTGSDSQIARSREVLTDAQLAISEILASSPRPATAEVGRVELKAVPENS